MSVVVQKFGGTSVGDAGRIKRVAQIVADTRRTGHQVAVIVSAMGHSTDELLALAHELVGQPSGRELDALLVTGEMVSAALLAMTLNAMDMPAVSLNGHQAGFKTEDFYNRARILEIDTARVRHHLDAGEIVIVTGFQGINSKGDFATLGRGGSDTSAVALAGALEAERCDIYTDVQGVYSTDPRIVPQAVKLDDITYIEMMELARVGAQVLHPRAVETARHANVQIRVRSTFYTDDMGTLVVDSQSVESGTRAVSGIASDSNQARVAITGVPDHPGVAAQVFGSLAGRNVSVDMIIQSLNRAENTNDIAFTVSTDELSDALAVLRAVQNDLGAADVVYDDNVAKVSIVGIGMIDQPGIAANMFKALSDAQVNIKMIATSEIKISCLIDQDQAKQAVQAIHSTFFPEALALEHVVNRKVGY